MRISPGCCIPYHPPHKLLFECQKIAKNFFFKDHFWLFFFLNDNFLAIFWQSNGNFPEGQEKISHFIRQWISIIVILVIYDKRIFKRSKSKLFLVPDGINKVFVAWNSLLMSLMIRKSTWGPIRHILGF